MLQNRHTKRIFKSSVKFKNEFNEMVYPEEHRYYLTVSNTRHGGRRTTAHQGNDLVMKEMISREFFDQENVVVKNPDQEIIVMKKPDQEYSHEKPLVMMQFSKELKRQMIAITIRVSCGGGVGEAMKKDGVNTTLINKRFITNALIHQDIMAVMIRFFMIRVLHDSTLFFHDNVFLIGGRSSRSSTAISRTLLHFLIQGNVPKLDKSVVINPEKRDSWAFLFHE